MYVLDYEQEPYIVPVCIPIHSARSERCLIGLCWMDDWVNYNLPFCVLTSSQDTIFPQKVLLVPSFFLVPEMHFLVRCSPLLKLLRSATTYPSAPPATWPIDSASCSLPLCSVANLVPVPLLSVGTRRSCVRTVILLLGWKGTEWPCQPLYPQPKPHPPPPVFLSTRHSPGAWWTNPFPLNQEGTVGGDILKIKKIIRDSFASTIDFGSREC